MLFRESEDQQSESESAFVDGLPQEPSIVENMQDAFEIRSRIPQLLECVEVTCTTCIEAIEYRNKETICRNAVDPKTEHCDQYYHHRQHLKRVRAAVFDRAYLAEQQ